VPHQTSSPVMPSSAMHASLLLGASTVMTVCVCVQVLQLWGDILLRLGAIHAHRELLDLTFSALEHHPRTAQDYVARANVDDWMYRQSVCLPRKGTFKPGQDPDTKLSLDNYRLLCNNQLGVVSACSSAKTSVAQTLRGRDTRCLSFFASCAFLAGSGTCLQQLCQRLVNCWLCT